jgi:hypothetical protein
VRDDTWSENIADAKCVDAGQVARAAPNGQDTDRFRQIS